MISIKTRSLSLRTFCLLITFIECTLAQSSSQSFQSSSSSNNNHSLIRSLYESNPLGETELSDVWLCLAFALGWTVWLLSSRQQAKVEPSIFDQKESLQVTGNVLEVTVGEDADGTGIPVYLALIDYVVECYDPDDDTTKLLMKSTSTTNRMTKKPLMKPQSPLNHPSSPPKEGKTSTEKFKKGVVLEHHQTTTTNSPTTTTTNNNHHHHPSSSKADRHLQIRKCFYTNKLLDVGFANVKVLCLVEDPTTSELWDDYLRTKRQRKKTPMEQNNWIHLGMVYVIAIVLIVASLYGGYRTVEHLPEDLREAGYISLATGAILLFPSAFFLWTSYCFVQRWISDRKGTIIHGSERWHCTRMACGIHPIIEEEDDDGNSSMVTNPKDQSSTTQRHRNTMKEPRQQLQQQGNLEDDENTKGLEMPKLHNASDAEYVPPKAQTVAQPPVAPPAAFPNAGCAMNEYNVQTLQNNPSTVSSISSTGMVATPHAESSLVACQDATSHLMEAFSAFGTGTTTASAGGNNANNWELPPKTTTTTLKKLGRLRRTSSESRLLPPLLGRSHFFNSSPASGQQEQQDQQDQEVTRIYSA